MNEEPRPLYKDVDARRYNDLLKQVEYWRSLAAHLASCHAATAEYDGSLKTTSAARRKRLRDICLTCALGLSGRWQKKYGNEGDVQAAIERCTKASQAPGSPST